MRRGSSQVQDRDMAEISLGLGRARDGVGSRTLARRVAEQPSSPRWTRCWRAGRLGRGRRADPRWRGDGDRRRRDLRRRVGRGAHRRSSRGWGPTDRGAT